MKTLKKFFTCLETLLKKNFFNREVGSLTSNCNSIADEKSKLLNDVEGMRLEEYTSKYKSTTRWQTV